MSYKKLAYHQVSCDGPGCENEIYTSAKADMEELQVRHGWVRVLDQHFCRECAKSRKAQERR